MIKPEASCGDLCSTEPLVTVKSKKVRRFF